MMNALHLSFDLDMFDPAFAPGVSQHEPGGLSTRQVSLVVNNQLSQVEFGKGLARNECDGSNKIVKETIGKMLLKTELEIMRHVFR